MSNLSQSPSPINQPPCPLRLIYLPRQFPDIFTEKPRVFWKLYTSDGTRYTNAVLTTREVMAAERRMRRTFDGVFTTFQYWQPEWM